MPSVVVTGVSTGIGHAIAKLLLDKGFRVFGSVRKPADAERLIHEFGANFTPLIFDVTDEAAVHAAAAEVRAALGGERLAGLINNAGIAVSGAVIDLSADDFRRQFEVNVIGPIVATQAFAPLLGTDDTLRGSPGRIVMMSSIAGKFGNPLMAAYSASKHALNGLSDGLRREMMLFGIDVVIVAPGAVKTPIWAKAEQEDVSRFANSPFYPALLKIRAMLPKMDESGLPPETIAQHVLDALTSPKPKAHDVITPGPLQFWLSTKLPPRWVDRIVARRLGLQPAK
ncbi:SDR family NAD(P)-dependent oxidoreductase [Rhodopseudomonas palustris]|uniref:SDR family NAD(P)-dependent oxidoreductase n=1 Tax=Rhodopseudomonas palustris TaxID=1076 RepID=UPI002ACDAFC1|nr:SDR family NAD(P)-dependent oxidoreductase [Rhodopseudomonas palustris]WQH00303.1 SDR family NAD(P)-dependent oxidoreductase [Rhodopseudomonas palustris]